MKAHITPFGQLSDGRLIELFTLTNSQGMKVKLMPFGASVVAIETPDREGKNENVVLGFNDVADYESQRTYFGACIGRVANRIGNACITIEENEFQLSANEGPTHIHGGEHGFDRHLWNAKLIDDFAVQMDRISTDGEQGYPGNLSVQVLYTMTESNELKIEYTATTDKPTVCNLTNHSYFNLAGSGDILNHSIWIDADHHTPVNEYYVPTGEIRSLDGNPCDFRSNRTVRDFHSNQTAGHGDNYCLNRNADSLKLAARAHDPISGRTLECLTDQPGLQFYDGYYLDFKGNDGRVFGQCAGLCLEPQIWPDAPNHDNFPSAILLPGQIYRHTCIYKFSVTT